MKPDTVIKVADKLSHGHTQFDSDFEVVLADTEYSRRIHYQLRYQVYCLEEGFEDRSQFRDEEERDHWDEQSVHFLVRARQSREWVAAMRMVISEHGALPIEKLCEIDPIVTPSAAGEPIAEISRICIIDGYRRTKSRLDKVIDNTAEGRDCRPKLAATGIQAGQPGTRIHKSLILKGLLRAAAIYSRDNDIPYWYFLTTPALARIISRLNVQLIKIGSACHHRGVRYPFLANIQDAIRQARKGCPDMAAMLGSRVDAYRRFSELEPAQVPADHCLVA